jgi:hypothetical protein
MDGLETRPHTCTFHTGGFPKWSACHRFKLLVEIYIVSFRIPWDSEMESSVTRGAASLGAAFFIFIGGEDIDSYS